MCNLKSTKIGIRKYSNCNYKKMTLENTYEPMSIENVLKKCRMLLLTDYIKTKPRRLVIDTSQDYIYSSKNSKEVEQLSEIVFGNFCLSSKADGYKIHFLRSQSEVIVSKVFNIPTSSGITDLKSIYKRVSPDSGRTMSISSVSSYNSNFSSCMSSVASSSSVHTVPYMSKINKKCNLNGNSETKKWKSATLDRKMNNGASFFSENEEIYNKHFLFGAVVLIFKVPKDLELNFEEYLFQYYIFLEVILNRLSYIIIDNKPVENPNAEIIDQFNSCILWLISLLPFSYPDPSMSEVKVEDALLEKTIEYFGRQNRLSFLSQLLFAAINISPLALAKFMKSNVLSRQPYYPYKRILETIGVLVDRGSFFKIVVKGTSFEKDELSMEHSFLSHSWRDRLISSVKNYKEKRNSSDNFINSNSFKRSKGQRYSKSKQKVDEVKLLVRLLDSLLSPTGTSVRQQFNLPIHKSFSSDSIRIFKMKNGKLTAEIPLLKLNEGILTNGPLMMLPQLGYHGQLSQPLITDRIVRSPIMLQGYVKAGVSEQEQKHLTEFNDEIAAESRLSQLSFQSRQLHPDYLIINCTESTVRFFSRPNYRIPENHWINKMVSVLNRLQQLPGYWDLMGHIIINTHFKQFARKAYAVQQLISENPKFDIHMFCSNVFELEPTDIQFIMNSKD